jgi:hypothetical protein
VQSGKWKVSFQVALSYFQTYFERFTLHFELASTPRTSA